MEKEIFYEKRKHGTPDFPIAYYYVDESHPRYFMPPHFHRETELIRIISGSLKLQLQAKTYLLKKDDIFFVNSGCLHQAVPENCVYECIVFNPSILKQAPSEHDNKIVISFINGELELKSEVTDSRLIALIDELFSVMKRKKSFYGLITYSILFEMFYLVMSGEGFLKASEYNRDSEKNKILADILEWLEKNYPHPITLDLLSANSGYSKKYLCRIFREYTGKTPIEYINELRLNAACRDIRYNGISVTAAAFKNGFNDLSYFCRIFKRYTGYTPKQYKRNTD